MHPATPSAARRRGLPAAAMTGATALWAAALHLLAGTAAAQHLSNAGLVLVSLLAGAAALSRARRDDGPTRRFWALLGAAVLSWSLGQTVWTWYETVLGEGVPFPSLADAGYLGLPPLATAALMSLRLGATSRAGRLRTLLDGAMVAASLLLCSWLLVLGPAFRAGGDDLLGQVISLAYPASDVALITIVVHAWSRARHERVVLPLSLPLVGAGLVCFAVADSGFTYLTNAGLYGSGSGIDVGWFAGFAVLLLAALRVPAPAPASAPRSGSSSLAGLLPYLAVSTALLVSVVDALDAGGTGPFVFWVRSFLLVVLIVRQVLTVLENQALTRHLEARVDARTAEVTASRQRFASLVAHSSDLVAVVDADAAVSWMSPSSTTVVGHRPEEIEGRSLLDLMDPEQGAQLLRVLASATPERRVSAVRSTWRHAGGQPVTVELTVTDLRADPHVRGLVLNGRDVTDRVLLEEQLTHQAFTDSLTSLPNRALFQDRLHHALDRRAAAGSAVAVFFLDLDGFKAVNDTLGHSVGDVLLQQVAERLTAVVRPGDTVARFGGDEFAVLVDTTAGAGASAHEELAQRILDAFADPFTPAPDHLMRVVASIGVATTETTAWDGEELLRNADLAMYQAKAAGAGTVAVYHAGMHTTLVERVTLEADLRRALVRGELFLEYQPMVRLATGAVTGVEALVRWRHPERGVVPPLDFVPLAEATGLIGAIGAWVLREACAQAVRWERATGGARLRMSVNLAAQQIQQPDLVAQVVATLAETGMDPGLLTLEMTESVVIDHSEATLATLADLRALGVRLAIDDFGTGYSSLSYLHRLPVDILKIDRSFVQRLGSDGDGSLVGVILGLARSLGLESVAEGVEEDAQLELLREQGCTTGQGYHFSRPVRADAVLALVRAQGEPSPTPDEATTGAVPSPA